MRHVKPKKGIHFLKEWLLQRDLKQVDVVNAIGVNKGTVSRWCSGELPSEEFIDPLARFLKVEPFELFRNPDRGNDRQFTKAESAEIQRVYAALLGILRGVGYDAAQAAELKQLLREVVEDPPDVPDGADEVATIMAVAQALAKKFRKKDGSQVG